MINVKSLGGGKGLKELKSMIWMNGVVCRNFLEAALGRPEGMILGGGGPGCVEGRYLLLPFFLGYIYSTTIYV